MPLCGIPRIAPASGLDRASRVLFSICLFFSQRNNEAVFYGKFQNQAAVIHKISNAFVHKNKFARKARGSRIAAAVNPSRTAHSVI
jgi:hypothetical protein